MSSLASATALALIALGGPSLLKSVQSEAKLLIVHAPCGAWLRMAAAWALETLAPVATPRLAAAAMEAAPAGDGAPAMRRKPAAIRRRRCIEVCWWTKPAKQAHVRPRRQRAVKREGCLLPPCSHGRHQDRTFETAAAATKVAQPKGFDNELLGRATGVQPCWCDDCLLTPPLRFAEAQWLLPGDLGAPVDAADAGGPPNAFMSRSMFSFLINSRRHCCKGLPVNPYQEPPLPKADFSSCTSAVVMRRSSSTLKGEAAATMALTGRRPRGTLWGGAKP
mmetsp:Transcript_102307/g.328043  ORF Transcript_102307/g.328043 Transcript_102307/m.328043 type:complete len:278 (+) Transcript_102307:274-1107(+)